MSARVKRCCSDTEWKEEFDRDGGHISSCCGLAACMLDLNGIGKSTRHGREGFSAMGATGSKLRDCSTS